MTALETSEKLVHFVGFVSDLTNSALQYLGRLKNKKTNQFVKDIQQAERIIQVLEMIEEKTVNNLSHTESDLIKNTLTGLKKILLEETQKEKQTVSIRHILVDDALLAQEIQQQLQDGSNFAEVARNSSVCSSRKEGGYIEGVEPGDLPKPVEEAIFKLNEDEISDIIRSVFGYHIVKLVEKKVQ